MKNKKGGKRTPEAATSFFTREYRRAGPKAPTGSYFVSRSKKCENSDAGNHCEGWKKNEGKLNILCM